MRILLADKFPDDHLAVVESLGHDCVLEPDLGESDLPGRIPGFDVLVVRSTKVNAVTIGAADKLQLVIRAGAGTNTIDTATAAEREIYVCNVPGKNAIAVAELAIGLMLCLDRNIPDNVADLRAQAWDKKRYSATRGLFGQTVGIIGMGAIGTEVAKRAHAFGMTTLVIEKADRTQDTLLHLQEIGVHFVANQDELVRNADILTVHVPAAEDTKHMINDELLAKLRPGAMFINTSRGDVVDEAALIRAMDEKGIRAGLDVYAGEPASGSGRFESILASHPNVYGTHHIGASTAQAQSAVAGGVVDILKAFADGTVLHCVNR